MISRRRMIWTRIAIGVLLAIGAQAQGTKQVDGQPCALTKYRVSTSYQTPGQRVQYTCTRPNGQNYSGIEVVSGKIRH